MRRVRILLVALAAGLALGVALSLPARVEGRTAEVHLIVTVDLQRLHPNAPPDEPIEPAPSLEQKLRTAIAAHPAFRGVTVRLFASETPPSPRVPAEFLRLVDHGVDEVVVVSLRYQMRLDGFRATGRAGVQGFVAVHSVAGRRKVLSRELGVTVAYPGDVTKEAVLQAELSARGRGATVPVEEIELGLLDRVVKERLEPELSAALGVYNPASLPQLSRQAVQEAMVRMARFLAESPGRRDEAIQMLEQYLERYPDSPHRSQLEARLRRLKLTGRDPGQDAQRRDERAAARVAQSVTAAELAELFERLVGKVVEVRAFKLDWHKDTMVMMPTGKKQDFVVDQAPSGLKELEVDPPVIYVLVVGRREDPAFPGIDVKVPVLRWIGCPREACPPKF